MDARREFAKDVAAFANAGGGYIFIGAATKTALVVRGEEVEALRPIPRNLFDPDQYLKIALEWLFPVPKDLDFVWIQWGDDQEKGIAVIFIPRQDERLKPFLITRTLGDKRSTEVLLGYVERRRDSTEVRSVVELHQALRSGFNFERELLGRLEYLESIIERHFSVNLEAQTAEKRDQLFNERIARLLDGGPAEELSQA